MGVEKFLADKLRVDEESVHFANQEVLRSLGDIGILARNIGRWTRAGFRHPIAVTRLVNRFGNEESRKRDLVIAFGYPSADNSVQADLNREQGFQPSSRV